MRLGSDIKVGLSPYYLNSNRLGAFGGIDIPADAQQSLNNNNIERVKAMQFAGSVARGLLRSGRVRSLTAAYASDPKAEQFCAFTTVPLIFRGSRLAFDDEARGKPVRNTTFRGSLVLGDDEMALSGELFNRHFYSQSSISTLSGKRKVFLMGHFHLVGEFVELSPSIIGDLVDDASPLLNLSLRGQIRVYPDHIDSFDRLSQAPAAKAGEVAALKSMSESSVKEAIAEIIGEAFIPPDWGGEASDLQTNRLLIDGAPASAAFIFKGPGLRGTMHPGNMGKNGDQLIRAFGEPVVLVVIQHCDKIANSVVSLAEALALDPRNPKWFCIMDGNDTARLLKAYGKLQF